MTELPSGAVDRLRELGTATLYEAAQTDCDLDPAITAAWPGARVAGSALPVRTGPEDNLALHLALEHAVPGDVLIVDAGGLACGYFGEVLAVAAQARGVAGLVIDGGVRDTARLAELDFPTFSRWIAVRRTAKDVTGVIGEPIVVAGRMVARGDIVVADEDGVIVLARESVEVTLSAAVARVEKEEAFLSKIREGSSTVDLYGFR
jgi:4-hydroxy-4-methyl-2-oxoglutarate aldolase